MATESKYSAANKCIQYAHTEKVREKQKSDY